MKMIYCCCDDRRREIVADHPTLNGIDYLEVLDDSTVPEQQRQRTLFVHFVKSLAPGALTEGNVRIEGGRRIDNIAVEKVTIGSGAEAHIMTLKVDRRGDFSPYTLRLVKDDSYLHVPPDGIDPILSVIDFSFKVNCPSDFDCKKVHICPARLRQEPDINYLAKDYESFRQLMLDRMSVLMPAWKERHAADLGAVLVELLAYVGDYLSYAQDATATEAYLATARRRVSARRHARLVDYFMHDGCNARTWVHVQVDVTKLDLKTKTPQGTTKFLTHVADKTVRIAPGSLDYDQALSERPEIFELMHDATLFQAHNKISFYTWQARECCLPKLATRATLKGHFPDLKAGNTLIFREMLDRRTGEEADADCTHRHAVLLTDVQAKDDGDNPLTDPLTGQEITEITWGMEDALPFALYISATTNADHGSQYIEDVSVALGNIVLTDHGLTIENESLDVVPQPRVLIAPTGGCGCCCGEYESESKPARFRPKLKENPLTHAAAFDKNDPPTSAKAAMAWTTEDILPAVYLVSEKDAVLPEWLPRHDLMRSNRNKKEFVVEVEVDGTAHLRFGDNRHGAHPASGTQLYSFYKVGNGTDGNVGAESLVHIVTEEAAITCVSNPIPAQGGADAESIKQVRHNAPVAFRRQERAVTTDDYAEVAGRYSGVQRAEATFRWTGSWHTVFLTVDRLYGLEVDNSFETSMREFVERFRMAGHDLEVDGPQMVSLEIEMLVCVKSNYFRSDVKTALLEVFSNRIVADGRRGVFHPDNFTFGQPVYLSRLYAAAQAVEGVASVIISTFQRQDNDSSEALEAGKLTLGRLEIARLDNDPNFPKNGIFTVITEGGK